MSLCTGYLVCKANRLPNGSRVLTAFGNEFLPDKPETCRYELFYHYLYGFSYCDEACARSVKFCRNNCFGKSQNL